MARQRPTPLGDFLRAELDRLGWSGRELAKQAGVSPNTVSQLLRGTESDPRFETLEALASVLGRSVEDLRRLADANLRPAGAASNEVTISTDPQRARYLRPLSRLPPAVLSFLADVARRLDALAEEDKRDLERRERGEEPAEDAL